MSYQETYKKWCTDPYFDAQTQEELKNLEGNEKEIEDCFYRQLEFAREATLCLNTNFQNQIMQYVTSILSLTRRIPTYR